jgi:hypothetical protein
VHAARAAGLNVVVLARAQAALAVMTDNLGGGRRGRLVRVVGG